MKSKLFSSRRVFLSSIAVVALSIKAFQSQSQNAKTTSNSKTNQANNNLSISLNGVGTSFPSFFYLRWFNLYNEKYPNIQITYQTVGTKDVVEEFMSKTVDFAASEVTLTDEFLSKLTEKAVFIPVTAASITVVYNLPGVKNTLKLSRQILADIFLGKITKWNDNKITELNSDITLPNLPITVVYRYRSGKATAAFTSYLSAISSEWKQKVGTGLKVKWPVGVAIKDNAGVSDQFQKSEGTIGYVESTLAKHLNLTTVALENKAGQFVQPDNESSAKTLATIKLADNLVGSANDPEVTDGYPIVTYSWLLAYKRYDDSQKAQALKEIIQWGLTEGQKFAPELGYVPLPPEVIEKASAALSQIR